MMQVRYTPIYAAVLTALLTGCASSGGGGGGYVPPTTPTTPTEPETPPMSEVNPDRITVPGGTKVTVAVVDSGARVSHSEFDGIITTTYNAFDGSSTVTDDNADSHGTAMASLIAGKTLGFSGNAELMIVKVSGAAGGTDATQANGVKYAAQHGARIVNSSTAGWQVTNSTIVDKYKSIANRDVVWVNAAGNGGYNITESRLPSAFFADGRTDLAGVRDRMLLVGMLNATGTDRDANSDYPGSNTQLQDRFVLAPGKNVTTATNASDTGTVTRPNGGTSSAAAVVSALASNIMAKWDHLTALEVTSLILDTADRTHSLYSRNNCGAASNENCGEFYMGQGIVDPEAALTPVGALTLALEGTVAGASVPVARTSLTPSAAFGNAFDSLSSTDVAAFDSYGRDYKVQLSMAPARTGMDRFGGVGAFMLRGNTAHSVQTADAGQIESWMRFNADGSPSAAAVSLHSRDSALTAYRFSYGESNPAAMPAGLNSLRMLSYNGGNAIASDYRGVTGTSGEVASGIDNLKVGFDAWHANNSASGLDGNDRSATRTEINLRYAPTNWMRVSLGVASLTEREAMLGTRATGALAFRNEAPFMSQTLSLDVVPMAGATLFARYETGSMGDLKGNALIESVVGIRASQFAAGATYGNEDFRAALIASSPLRVDSATARLAIPTGRTTDGEVTMSRYSADLAPSGRERSVEFAFSARAGKQGVVQMNMSRTFEPGHNAAAQAVNMVTVSYGHVF